jgi:hypothetical protein
MHRLLQALRPRSPPWSVTAPAIAPLRCPAPAIAPVPCRHGPGTSSTHRLSISRSSSPHLGTVVASSPRTPSPSLPRPIISPHQHIAPDDAALSAPLHAASAAIYLYRKRGPGKGEWTSSNCSMSNLFCCASDAFMRSWHLVAQPVVSSLFHFLPLVLSSENFRCYSKPFRL